jgi:gas vesicle protein
MSSKQVLLGVAAGAVIGAVVGILSAPDKGTDTRKKLSRKGSEVMDSITKKFEKMKKDVTDLAENGNLKEEKVTF